TNCVRALYLPALVDVASTAVSSAERSEVHHRAILPKAGVLFTRGGIALTHHSPAIVNRLSWAIGSAQRPKVDYREQRIKTGGRVAEAGCKAEERILALRSVAVRMASVQWRVNRSGRGRKPKADKR